MRLPYVEYRRGRADMLQVYKILNYIDRVDKEKKRYFSWQPIHQVGAFVEAI